MKLLVLSTKCQNMASTIADLPAELIEAVLVMAAASGNPNSIAALSQTSKLFYRLIYCCPDQHLWREIFLTTFDDPRPALNHMSTMSGGHPNLELNWTQEYIDRISAARYIRRPVQTMAPVSSQSEVLRIPASLSVVKALLSVITTSLPFPSSLPLSLTVLTELPVSNAHFATQSSIPHPNTVWSLRSQSPENLKEDRLNRTRNVAPAGHGGFIITKLISSVTVSHIL